jgi:F-type H+-transporting ATPase subunit epsilon
MSNSRDPLTVTIITPQGFCRVTEAIRVQANTEMGPIEILQTHAPLISLLKPGKVKVVPIENKKAPEIIYISGSGVLEVINNKVNILADNGFYGQELDTEVLRQTEQELRKKLQDNTVKKVAETLDALNEVTEKLKIAEEIKNESMRS